MNSIRGSRATPGGIHRCNALSVDGAPIGFRDLQRRCDDMSSSVLSTRLTELREAGIAASTSTAAQPAWHLTALGDDLVTAMGPLLDWSRAWA
ncbi:winged helix-turn-helix transcriptional regulator [Streptomyces mirabilis]|uniref:winged helix-turn-helix transcriptional regulator n=1 Tax=Streptomyces mirabilis TaxID=68239 RepID=UPI0036BDC15C